MTTQDEARRYLLSLLPPGIEKVWDLEPGGDFYKLIDAMALLLRVYGFDLLDTVRAELFPNRVVQKLTDWEAFLGIARFFVARFGSIAQRQQAVVSKIREKGPFSDPNVQAIVGPLLGYAPTSLVEVLRADRSALRLLHTYSPGTVLTVPDGDTLKQKLWINDGGRVGRAGARLIMEFADVGPYAFDVTIQAPGLGHAQTWSLSEVDGSGLRALFGTAFPGDAITGNWSVSFTNHSGVDLPVIWSLFVEGIARDQFTGGAVWAWGVYADPAHVGEQGFSDLEATEAAIERMKHSHSFGSIITSKEPWPGEETGDHQAIPGRCFPSG